MIWAIAYVAVAVFLIAVASFACGFGGDDEPLAPMFWCSVGWGPVLIALAVLAPFWGIHSLGAWLKARKDRP